MGHRKGRRTKEEKDLKRQAASISLLNQPTSWQIKPTCFLNCLLLDIHVLQPKYLGITFSMSGTFLPS